MLHWIITVLLSFHTLYFLEPAVKEGIIAGEVEATQISPELLLIFGLMYLGPFIMVFLSLNLKDSTNRWANIIMGVIYTILGIIDLGEHFVNPSVYGNDADCYDISSSTNCLVLMEMAERLALNIMH